MERGFYKLDARAALTVSTTMTRRLLLLVTMLSISSVAQASWYPRLDSDNIVLTVGQQETVGVQAVWSGFSSPYPFTPWHFNSDDSNVAIVEGGKEQLGDAGAIKITAIAPGTAHVRLGSAGPFATINVGGSYPPPQIALSSRIVTPGQTLTLTAIFPFPAFYIWYDGALGDRTTALGAANTLTYVAPTMPGTYHVWLTVMTPTSTGMAEATIDVVEPRRRAARH
jgi:hypothetical protein